MIKLNFSHPKPNKLQSAGCYLHRESGCYLHTILCRVLWVEHGCRQVSMANRLCFLRPFPTIICKSHPNVFSTFPVLYAETCKYLAVTSIVQRRKNRRPKKNFGPQRIHWFFCRKPVKNVRPSSFIKLVQAIYISLHRFFKKPTDFFNPATA
jgi:hypothetical protein